MSIHGADMGEYFGEDEDLENEDALLDEDDELLDDDEEEV